VNLRLTDRLTCPACDAGVGLILLADRVSGGRAAAGRLGCPNCRARYEIVEGTADFVGAPAPEKATSQAADASELAAWLGVTEGPAMVLLLGAFEEAAAALAALVEDVEVVVAQPDAQPHGAAEGVSVLRIGPRIPLYDGSMRGVVVGAEALQLSAEAVRVCAIAGRIVVLGDPARARSALDERSVRVLAERADALVAVRHA
jgi:uncharacterized protein YbaR (Trm112 family)